MAALTVAAFLVSAALAASFAAAAASSLDFASALAVSSCVPRSAALAAAFCLRSSARALASSVFAAASALSAAASAASALRLSDSSLRSDAVSSGRLAHRCRGGFLRHGGRLDGLRGLADERLGPRRSGRDGLRVRHEQRRMGKRHRGRVVRRDDHPHPDPRLVEHLLGKTVGHPYAAVRGRIAGQRAAVQRDAVPGDALHVRHPGIVIHGRVVVLVLLDDGEDAGRRLASLDAGRYRRAQDPAVGVVEGDLLGLDRHDRHDRLARLARRRRLGRRRGARLSGGGAGAQRRQRGHRRERHKGGGAPKPDRHGGPRRRKSIYHAMPLLKRLSAPASIKCQITIFGLITRHHHPHRRFVPGD